MYVYGVIKKYSINNKQEHAISNYVLKVFVFTL
jgi:hypothetical protein